MLKKMAWNTFKNTGNIDTMMELLEVSQLENKISQKTQEKTKQNSQMIDMEDNEK